jgi:hypothetical protein
MEFIMGPITLFDKSFLQSLSIDESVWFDHFFLTNVAPLFYIETLGDLDKLNLTGRSSEEEVRIIAEKFPDMHGTPCSNHRDLCISNLLGNIVPMTGQIPISRGRLVKSAGKPGLVAMPSLEAEAFSRWQNSEFLEIEQKIARYWRKELQDLNLQKAVKYFTGLGIDIKNCKSLKDSHQLAINVVDKNDNQNRILSLVFNFLHIPNRYCREIKHVWEKANKPALSKYAPYAAFVLKVELFFHIAMAANLISTERPSNSIDIAYLFYLPFCMMFVSNDKLHHQCAPLFLRSDQDYTYGLDLKKSLSKVNEFYLQSAEDINKGGIISLSNEVPKINDPLLERLQDRVLQNANKIKKKASDISPSIEEIRSMENAPTLLPEEIDFNPTDVDRVLLKRKTRKTRGSWCQIPT